MNEETKQSRVRYEAVEAQNKRWKERITEEKAVTKALAKDISDLKHELSEVTSRQLQDERALEELRATVDISKKMRDAAEISVKEWMARAERAERELGSKRQMIGGFEATKRTEIEALREVIEKLNMEMRETEMTLEEVWSRGSAVTIAY